MDDSFFKYLQQLELIGFFSGYPLLYALVILISSSKQTRSAFISRMAGLLPYTYALVGTLYLGLQLKNLYPDYSMEHIKQAIQIPALMLWGLLAILCWIPALGKRRILSLLHSLVIFFLVVKDAFIQLSGAGKNADALSNDMHLYSDSLLLNLACFAAVATTASIILKLKKVFAN